MCLLVVKMIVWTILYAQLFSTVTAGSCEQPDRTVSDEPRPLIKLINIYWHCQPVSSWLSQSASTWEEKSRSSCLNLFKRTTACCIQQTVLMFFAFFFISYWWKLCGLMSSFTQLFQSCFLPDSPVSHTKRLFRVTAKASYEAQR